MTNLRHPPPNPVTRWAVHDATGDEVELEPTRTWFEARSAACREFTAKFGRTVDPSEVTIHDTTQAERVEARNTAFVAGLRSLCRQHGVKMRQVITEPEACAVNFIGDNYPIEVTP